ncbi:MAG: hypothetical protein A2V98_22590 [Planctomycetes bacterium RBG_16_64_12]|nr:MAG: hypothetical protein A2V98_22590 [Planctomycetes bacterium RBG_16_64_12]
MFYDNDFSYLVDPNYSDWHLGDRLKRLAVADCVTLDVGGQFRVRQHSERNSRLGGLTGLDDDFLLYRTRLYANVQIGECLRAYAEMIDAVSNYETFGPLGIEENRTDFLNLFGDARIYQTSSGELWARLGRQELLYGAERTVSPLDWANTRRTFEGYKAFWKGETWDVDAFWVRPIQINAEHFDSPDYDQEFMGLYTTYHGSKNGTLDLYYLRLENDAADFEFDTLGTRLLGTRGPWLWEVEAAIQLGDYQQFDHTAGAWTVGMGRKLQDLPWKPTVWAYYDWASGDDQIGNGYHHLFPLGHKYLGFMDLFGRRNIESPNVLVTMSPCEKVKLLLWYYAFFLENQNDVPYTLAMTPFNPANAPASAYLGQEFDLITTWQISTRTNLLFGYSHFFAGDYYHNTPGVPHDGDADFFYTQFALDF